MDNYANLMPKSLIKLYHNPEAQTELMVSTINWYQCGGVAADLSKKHEQKTAKHGGKV